MEQHASLRFAWLRSTRGLEPHRPPTSADRLILVGYNAVWWVPLALVVAGLVSYRVGLLAFLAVSVSRAAVNLYRTNIMPVERALSFPLRLP